MFPQMSLFGLCIVFLGCPLTGGHHPIPKDILANLRNSSTIQEVLGKMNLGPLVRRVVSSVTTHFDVETTTRPRIATAGIRTSYFARINRARNNVVHDDRIVRPFLYNDEIETIDEPKQSTHGSCIVRRICTPLPIKREIGVYYFPECIDVDQCLGGCCDVAQNCRPTEISPIRVKVTPLSYNPNKKNTNFTLQNPFYVQINRHVKCQCDSCFNKPNCADSQRLVGCLCECKNMGRAKYCIGENRRWSNESCACECDSKPCPRNHLFSVQDCKCSPHFPGSKVSSYYRSLLDT